MLLTGLIALEPKAEAAGSAPVAANLELTTYRGVSVGGSWRRTIRTAAS